MESLIGIVVLAVLFGIAWGLRSILNFTARKANETIFQRGRHQKGEELLSTQVYFTAPSCDAETIRAAMLSQLSLEPAGTLKRTLELADEKVDADGYSLTFRYGNKMAENFRTNVLIQRTPGGSGTQGLITVIEALAADGILTHVDELGNWRHDIVAAIQQTDSQAVFTQA